MFRFALFLLCLALPAAAARAQSGDWLPLYLDLAGRPGVPPGVSGQIFVPVPVNAPPPAPTPPPPPSNDVLRGPPGDVLHGPPGDPLTGAPPSHPPRPVRP